MSLPELKPDELEYHAIAVKRLEAAMEATV